MKWFQRSRRATTEENGARSGVFRPIKQQEVVGGLGSARNSDFKPIRITETSLTAKIPIFNDTMTQEEAHAQLLSR